MVSSGVCTQRSAASFNGNTVKFGDVFGTQLGYLSVSSPAAVPHSFAPWHRVRCPKLTLTGTKEVPRAMRTLILVLLPAELGPSVLLRTQNHRSSWQGMMVHGHRGAQVSMEGPAKSAPGRRQRAAGYHWEPGPEEQSHPLKGEPPIPGDEPFPCVSALVSPALGGFGLVGLEQGNGAWGREVLGANLTCCRSWPCTCFPCSLFWAGTDPGAAGRAAGRFAARQEKPVEPRAGHSSCFLPGRPSEPPRPFYSVSSSCRWLSIPTPGEKQALGSPPGPELPLPPSCCSLPAGLSPSPCDSPAPECPAGVTLPG